MRHVDYLYIAYLLMQMNKKEEKRRLELVVKSQNYNAGEYLYDFETDAMIIFNKFVIE